MSRGLEGSKGASHAGIWEKSIPSRGNGKCKGSEMGMGQPHCQTAQRTVWLDRVHD